MKIAGLITEYNPFHFGHIIHLQNSKKITGATHTLAIMSGSFVQRGEPAIVDKWTKAEMAIKNGVDLVIELPLVYSVQTAELFALGATKMLNSTNSIDYLVFGSELGDITNLMEISKILVEEPPFFKKQLKIYLNQGYSFPTSRSLSLRDYSVYKNINIGDSLQFMKESNNILGIEYLKALYRLDSNIIPFTFKRTGDNYKEQKIKSNIPSASALRYLIKNKGIESVKCLLPELSYYPIENFISTYGMINELKNYEKIINYLFCTLTPESIAEYFDVEEGLENRIKNLSKLISNVNNLIQLTATKRYTKTRIQRIIVHLLLGLKKDVIKDAYAINPSYIRILGSNSKGFEIINKIKQNSNLHVINKLTDSLSFLNEKEKAILQMDVLSTDLFFLGLELDTPKPNMDYKTSPYIHK